MGKAGMNIMNYNSALKNQNLPPAGYRMRPPTGERNFNEIVIQSPEMLDYGPTFD